MKPFIQLADMGPTDVAMRLRPTIPLAHPRDAGYVQHMRNEALYLMRFVYARQLCRFPKLAARMVADRAAFT